MNKIYKVMYSKVKQCAVVVSEIAKSHSHNGESSGVRKHAALTAAVLIALGGISFTVVPIAPVAADFYRNDYVGTNYEKDNGKSYAAKETRNYHGNGAKGVGSNTLGLNAIAGKNTVTIGDRDASLAQESVYIGSKYDANNQVHPSSGKSVVSVGYGSDAAGTGSIAIGSGASADTFDNAGTGTNPDSDSQSIAIGNNAVAKQNNIAIGAGSVATAPASKNEAYLSGQAAVSSYVSVGKSDALRRISNVADGAADSDVATIGQLKKLSARAGVYNEGWGIKIGDYTKKDANGQETTVKNAISIDRNLGSNEITSKSNNTFEAAGENSLILGGAGTDDFVVINGKHREKDYGSYGKDSVLVGGENNKTTKDGTYAVISGGGQNIASGEHSFIGGGWWNTATGATSTVVGGQTNTASGNQSTVVGGQDSRAIGDESTILGGFQHTAVGENSTISGGAGAYTLGQYSSVSGGQGNIAIGMTSSADGGWLNFAYGDWSQASGGYSNYVLGNASNSLGGRDSVIQGNLSVGIAGGSTGQGAGYALAAGYQSVVTAEGVHREKSSDSIVDSYLEAGNDTGGNEGYKYTDVATALGYQATANETNTVSFGHDKGDVSGYAVNWDIKYDTDDQGNIKFNEDGMPLVESIKANGITTNHYDSAKYNRLVKVADGINNHDVVVMEQLRNADNVGKNAKNNVVVYKENQDGTLQVDENGEAIIDVDASKAATEKATEQAIKDSEDAWGSAIGTGKVEANNSQLVTGDTVYNAIQNQAEWKLTTNGESADKAAAIKPGTTVNFSAEKNGKDHSNVTISHNGSNVTIGLDKDIVLGDTSHSSGGSLNVYTDSSDGNNLSNHVSINGSTISVNYPKSNGDKKTPTDTRGVILGVGEEDSKPDGYIAFNNVEGGYTYLHASTATSDDKKCRLEYVGSDGNKKYIANLDDVSTAVNNAKTKYYSVTNSFKLGDYRTNENNDGATDAALAGMAAGYETGTAGIASTVVGSYSGVMNTGTSSGILGHDVRGAAAVSVGTVNVNNNSTSKTYSGVANSIVGQANMTTNSNATIIYGAGNTVTDSYRPIDEKKAVAILTSISDPAKLSEALQAAVKDSGGQVMVMGGGNNVESAYMSQVVGVGNTVKGNQVKNTKGEWDTDTSDTAIKDYDPEKSSQYNYVDGFNNEVINGKHDYIIGANNQLDGDSYDDNSAKPIKRSNKSNVVIGDNHALTGKKNNVIIGSTDTEGTLTRASDAVIIGHNANATSATGADNAVAIGRAATATGGNAVTIGVNTSAGDNSITIGSESGAISGQNIAIGRYAQVDGYKVTKAVALGQKAKAQVTDGVAIGSNSIATVAGNSVEGYDPTTGRTSTDPTAAWKATKAAVSIGTADGKVTRQINGVAAGTNDTDAVNVAQIKKLASVDASNIGKNFKDGDVTTNEKAWGEALGTGTVTKDDDGSKQLVTGGTVYNEVRPSKDGKYVKIAQTTGANLIALDDQVKQNAQNISDNTYAQGDGILMDKTKKTISVNKGDGLKFTEDHKLAVYTGNGLKIDNGAVAIKTSDSNLKVDSNGIGLSDKITIGSDKTKQVTIDGTKGEISGLTNTTWDSKADYSKSTKAATESQVDAAVKDAVKQAGENDIHVAAGSYAVNDQNQVSMNLVDKNNDTKGTVIITDVAKSSEMGDVSKLADGVKNAGGKTTTVVDAINNVNTSMNTKIGDQKYSTSNTSGSNKYVQDGDSITSAIGKLDGAVQQATTAAGQHSTVSAGSNITVTPAKQTDGHTDYQVALNKDITVDSVTAKTATTDTLTVNNSATIGGVTIANKTISGLDDTKIEKGSTNAVNAGTIWNELRPSGGTYINQNNTTAQNIMNLDTQVKKNSDLVNSDGSTIKIGGKDSATKVDISDKNGSGRVVTGVVTDAADPTSAANVGYVNGVTAANTQQIYRDMNNAYGRLNNNINKAAAGSNALAALHPLDYDPDDKADFAVGYGHYRNANAAAVGAFYHPNENTMVNVGVSLGNGDPGFNAGVSFKVGRGGAGREAMSKTEMAKVINSQSKEIDALKKDNADKDKRIDALEQKMAEILAKLDKNGK